MADAKLNQDILAAFAKVTKKEEQTVWVKPYSFDASNAEKNQFVLFLKPEATATGVKTDAILDLVTSKLAEFKVDIGAVRVVGGDYLRENSIMDQHYGVINEIYRKGADVISASAKAKLAEVNEQKVPVIGGRQFLDKYPDFNEFSLCTLNDNLGTTRLAGGTYAMRVKVSGEEMLVLNPFHGYQLVPYTTSGHAIIVLECRSSTSWDDLRNKLCGVTKPEKAQEGSIRRTILAQKDALGLTTVDQGSNCVHLSAGPLEGMVELLRFCNEKEVTNTAFGALLAKKGVEAGKLNALKDNPDLPANTDGSGEPTSAFDLTEEINATDSVSILADRLSHLKA